MDFDSTVNTIKEFFQGLVTNFGAGTVVDGIILLFLLFTMIMGARRGFALTMIGFAQWFVCVILGFVFCGGQGMLISYTSTTFSRNTVRLSARLFHQQFHI